MSNRIHELLWAGVILGVALLGWSGLIGEDLASGAIAVTLAAFAAFGTRHCAIGRSA